MMQPIETPRLIIRNFEQSDIDSVARILDDCFGPSPRDKRAEWLDWCVRNYRALAELHQPPYGDRAIVLRGSGKLIGSVGLVPCLAPFGKLPAFRSRANGESNDLFTPEVGLFWAIESAHRKSGYATEAAKAMVQFAFEQMHVARIVATTEHDNVSSIEVMKRLGMQIDRNPDPDPFWFQTVGVLFHPTLSAP